jgi:hypothetical protein
MKNQRWHENPIFMKMEAIFRTAGYLLAKTEKNARFGPLAGAKLA